MTRKIALGLLAAAVAIAVVAYWAFRDRREAAPGAPPPPAPPASGAAPASGPSGASGPALPTARVALYLLSPADGLLRRVECDLPRPASDEEFARRILEAEASGASGPSGPSPALASPFPPKTTVRSVFLAGNGLVVADLNVDPAWARQAGSSDELALAGAVVNGLLSNIPGSTRVQILVNGSSVETLAGHVDISRPLPALPDTVGGGSAGPTGAAGPSGGARG